MGGHSGVHFSAGDSPVLLTPFRAGIFRGGTQGHFRVDVVEVSYLGSTSQHQFPPLVHRAEVRRLQTQLDLGLCPHEIGVGRRHWQIHRLGFVQLQRREMKPDLPSTVQRIHH